MSMASKEDIESYLVRLGLPSQEVGDGMWVVRDVGDDSMNMVVHLQPPLVVFRVKLMELPQEGGERLMRKLLELNATDMVSGAYGIEGSSVVCVETLQSENLDYNEFLAAVDSLQVAMTEHYQTLREYR
jgi:hypothetical protein